MNFEISNSAIVNDKIWPFLSGIRALVVLDGRPHSVHYASFGPGDPSTDILKGDAYFGLSEFIRTLTHSAPYFSPVLVTKAHRDTDVRGAADIENFRFDKHDLSVYDEIFLFGVASPDDTNSTMSDAELIALATFMDGGGGVFATGDHEDLGVVLNGRVLRVRSMRKWYYPSPGPLGEPVAPPAIGVERIETTQPSRGNGTGPVYFDNQSDDIPQPLELRWYTQQQNSFSFSAWRYPHPLLCGSNGPIQVAADHMHEGEVIVPWDTSATLKFGHHSFVEYPADKLGRQPLPEIVAWGKVLAERDLSTELAHAGDPQNTARSRSFGVVGAYDGHQAGVGRVAVDSTWHHFFDINLIGDPIASFPKTQGFKASPDGIQALEDIRSYFRNLAIWLARPGALSRIFSATAWLSLRTQPLSMIVSPKRDYTYNDLVSIGTLALKTVYRFVPWCSVLVSLIPYYQDGPVRTIPPDPWAEPHPNEMPLINPDIYLQVALGSAVVALAVAREKIIETDPQEGAAIIHKVAREGITNGMRKLGTELNQFAEGLGRLAHGLMQQENSST